MRVVQALVKIVLQATCALVLRVVRLVPFVSLFEKCATGLNISPTFRS